MSINVADLVATLTMDTSGFDAGAASANQQIQGMATGMGSGFLGLTAMRDIANGLTDAVGSAAQNQQNLVNANALLSNSYNAAGQSMMLNQQQLGQLGQQAQQTASQYGQSMGDVTNAIYDAVSSGYSLQQNASGTSDAMNIVNASAQAAVAGLTSVDTAQQGLITTLDAMGMSTNQAQQAEDSLFETVNLSRGNFDQLSSSLGNNLQYAHDLGINMNELGAAYASATLQGQTYNQAATQQSSLFRALINPNKEMTAAVQDYTKGQYQTVQAWLDAQEPGQKLGAILDMLNTEFSDNSAGLAKAVGRTEGMAGALELMGNKQHGFNDEYKQFTDALTHGSPELAAYQAQMEGTGIHLQMAGAALDAMKNSLVTGLLPAVKLGAEGVQQLAMGVMHLPEGVQTGIAAFIGLGAAISSVALAARFLGPLLESLLPQTAPFLGVAGLAAAGIMAYQSNFLGFGDLVNGIASGAGAALQRFQTAFESAFSAEKAAHINDLSAAIMAFGAGLANMGGGSGVLNDIGGKVADLGMAVDSAQNAMNRWTDGGINGASAALHGLAAGLNYLIGDNQLSQWLDNAANSLNRFGTQFTQAQQVLQARGFNTAAADVIAFGDALTAMTGIDVTGFFDRIGHAIQDFAGTMAAGAAAGLNPLQSALYGLANAFQDLTGINVSGVADAIVGAFNSIGSAIQGKLPDILQGVTNLITALSTLGTDAITGNFDKLGGDIQIDLANLASNIQTGIQNVVSGLSGLIIRLDQWSVDVAIPTLIGWVQQAAGWLQQNILPYVQGAAGLILRLAAWSIDVAIPTLIGWVQQAAGWLQAQLTPIVAGAGGLILRLASWSIDVAIPTLIGWVQQAAGWLQAQLTPIVAGAGGLILRLAQWSIDVGIPTLVGWVQQAAGWIQAQLTPIVQGAGGLILRLAAWSIDVGIPTLTGWVQQAAGWLQSQLQTYLDAAKGIALTFAGWTINVAAPDVGQIIINAGDIAGAVGKAIVDAFNAPTMQDQINAQIKGADLGGQLGQMLVAAIGPVTLMPPGGGGGHGPGGGDTSNMLGVAEDFVSQFLAGFLGALGNAFVTGVQERLNDISAAAQQGAQAISTAIQNAFTSAFSGATTAQGVSGGFHGPGSPTAANATSMLSNLIDPIVTGIVAAVQQLPSQIQGKLADITSAAQAAAKQVQTTIQNAFQSAFGSAGSGDPETNGTAGGSGMLQQVATSIFQAIQGGLQQAVSMLSPGALAGDVQGIANNIGAAVVAAVAKIPNFAGDMAKALQDALAGAAGAGPPDTIDPKTGLPIKQEAFHPDQILPAGEVFGGQSGQGGMGASLGNQIVQGIAAGIQNASVAPITTAISALLSKAFGGGVNANSGIAGGGIATGGGGGPTSGMGQQIGQQLVQGIAQAIQAGGGQVQSALASLLQSMTSAITAQTTVWGQIVQQAMTTVATAVTTGMTTVQTAVTAGLQTITSALTAQAAVWSQIVSQAFAQMAAAATSGMQGVVSAVQSGMQQVTAAVQAGAQQAVAALQAAAGQAQSAGVQFAQGFANGISSGTGAVAAAASQLVAAAMSSLQAGIQSASPSKLTNLEGQNFGAGFQQGIQSTGGAVQQAAQGIAQQAISALGLPTAQSAMQQVVGSLGKAADAVQQTAQGMSQLGQATQSLTDATKSLYGAPTASGLQQGVFGNLPPAVQSYFGSWDAIQKVIDATLKPASLPTRPTNAIASQGSAPTNSQPTTLNATLVLDGGGFNKAVLGTALAPLIPAAQNVGSRGTVRGQ